MPEYWYTELIDTNIIPDDCDCFNCNHEYISELPELPSRLTQLYCCFNNIADLPELPSGLEVLYCSYNPIKYITSYNYNLMKKIFTINNRYWIDIKHTIFYDNSGFASYEDFFRGY